MFSSVENAVIRSYCSVDSKLADADSCRACERIMTFSRYHIENSVVTDLSKYRRNLVFIRSFLCSVHYSSTGSRLCYCNCNTMGLTVVCSVVTFSSCFDIDVGNADCCRTCCCIIVSCSNTVVNRVFPVREFGRRCLCACIRRYSVKNRRTGSRCCNSYCNTMSLSVICSAVAF